MRSLKRYAFGTGLREEYVASERNAAFSASEQAMPVFSPLSGTATRYRAGRRATRWGKISHTRRTQVHNGSFGQSNWSQFWTDVKSLCNPFALRAGIAMVLVGFMALGVWWYVKYDQRCVVTLDIGNDRRQIQTQMETVGDLLGEYGIVLGAADEVVPPIDTPLYANMRITVHNASNLWVRADGDIRQVCILNGTVKDALELADITLGELDQIEPSLDSAVYPGMQINIARIEKKREVLYETVPFKTVVEKTDSLVIGTQKVASAGKDGEIMREMEITLKDGKEIEREQVASMVTKAQNRVILQGTGAVPTQTVAKAAETRSASVSGSSSVTGSSSGSSSKKTSSSAKSSSSSSKSASSGKSSSSSGSSASVSASGSGLTIGGKNYSYSRVLSGKATAYTHTGNRTASGVWPSVGTVAVDPSVIPMGTRLYIPGYGFGVAQDTGDRFIRGNNIDLFMDTVSECRNWGMRSVKIYIRK